MKKLTYIILIFASILTPAMAIDTSDISTQENIKDVRQKSHDIRLFAIREYLINGRNSPKTIVACSYFDHRLAEVNVRPTAVDTPVNREELLGGGYLYLHLKDLGMDFPSIYNLSELQR